MGLFRRGQTDDVDVESCLANLYRVDEIVPPRVVDVRGHEPAVIDLSIPEPTPTLRREQQRSAAPS